jgi:hypothetical protein
MATKVTTHRTTVDLDMHAVDQAREVLGTTTIRETIDRALNEVVRFQKLKRAADLIREGNPNLATPEDVTKLRRIRKYG